MQEKIEDKRTGTPVYPMPSPKRKQKPHPNGIGPIVRINGIKPQRKSEPDQGNSDLLDRIKEAESKITSTKPNELDAPGLNNPINPSHHEKSFI